MAKYVDGFVIPIKKTKVKDYVTMARRASRVWLKHGAVEYFETVGDDLKIKGVLPFPKLAKAKKDETVIFAFITYRSRAHRDKVNAKVMKDPAIRDMCGNDAMPFNPKRMAYGGFKVLVFGAA